MSHFKVKDLMSLDTVIIEPEQTLADAALRMKETGCGILPVGRSPERIEGVITDRDIVIRALALGRDPCRETVRNYMTERVIVCDEDDSLETAADKMHAHQVSRLIVKDKHGELSGILTFGTILRREVDENDLASIVKHAIRPQEGRYGDRIN